jgi:cytoskeleton protein RodZ
MALFTRRKHGGDVAAGARDEDSRSARRAVTIGELLRETREQYGASIEQIGAALRIRPVFLQAIEDNNYDRLPGPVYAVGFVRTYADYLGLDGASIAQRFKSEAAGLETKPDLSFPMPVPERSMPGGALLLVALIVAACAYAVWYYRAAGDRVRTAGVAEVPAQLIPLPPPAPASEQSPEAVPPEGGSSAASGSPPAMPSIEVPTPQSTAPSAPPEPAGAQPVMRPGVAPGAGGQAAMTPPPTSVQPEPARLPAIPEPPAAAPTLDTPRVYGITNGPVRIVIKATADSWIQVRDTSQTVVAMRILKPGESYRVPDRPGLTLATGNAGALDVMVDGRPVAPLGPVGKRRSVALDPERLMAGTATAE